MDLPCPICTEPTDNDELHYVAEETNSTYRQVYTEFMTKGCSAIYGGTPCESSGNPMVMAAIYDLMGDDSDGVASMYEDAKYFGLI